MFAMTVMVLVRDVNITHMVINANIVSLDILAMLDAALNLIANHLAPLRPIAAVHIAILIQINAIVKANV